MDDTKTVANTETLRANSANLRSPPADQLPTKTVEELNALFMPSPLTEEQVKTQKKESEQSDNRGFHQPLPSYLTHGDENKEEKKDDANEKDEEDKEDEKKDDDSLNVEDFKKGLKDEKKEEKKKEEKEEKEEKKDATDEEKKKQASLEEETKANEKAEAEKKRLKADTSLPKTVATFAKVSALLGVPKIAHDDTPEGAAAATKALHERCKVIHTNLLNALPNDPGKSAELTMMLEQPLPDLGEVNLDDPTSVTMAVDTTLKDMLGLPADATSAHIDTALEGKGVAAGGKVQDVRKFIEMRIGLDMQSTIDINELTTQNEDKKDQFDSSIESLKAHEELMKRVASNGRSDDLQKAMDSPNGLNAKQIEEMQQQKTATKIAEGVYAALNASGKPFVVITSLTQDSAEKTVAFLKNSKSITWTKVTDPKEQSAAEKACLEKGKRCFFKNPPKNIAVETPLSKAMPEGGRDFVKWLNSIETQQDPSTKPEWRNQTDNLQRQLIQDVIGENVSKLKELWKSVSENSTKNPNSSPKPADVAKHLTENQTTKLASSLGRNIDALNKKLEEANKSRNITLITLYEKKLVAARGQSDQLYQGRLAALAKPEALKQKGGQEALDKAIKEYAKYLATKGGTPAPSLSEIGTRVRSMGITPDQKSQELQIQLQNQLRAAQVTAASTQDAKKIAQENYASFLAKLPPTESKKLLGQAELDSKIQGEVKKQTADNIRQQKVTEEAKKREEKKGSESTANEAVELAEMQARTLSNQL